MFTTFKSIKLTVTTYNISVSIQLNSPSTLLLRIQASEMLKKKNSTEIQFIVENTINENTLKNVEFLL